MERPRRPGGVRPRSAEWVRAGARLVGGCCRTGPEHIRRIREQIA
ncbi:homocysteine S-methyltransferase family protein [Nocardiopsis composta]